MALSNSDYQKRYRESRLQPSDRHLTCWLGKDDNERLLRLMVSLGYTNVIGLALA